MSVRIITNNVPRPVVRDFELTPAERAEFDYLDWEAIENGERSAEFVRYKGNLIDLSDFERGYGTSRMPAGLEAWDNYRSDSFFSGVVIKWGEDFETVIVGTYIS